MTEPPYGVIWNKFKSGNIVPFLGAGASFAGRPANTRWDPAHPVFLPSGGEISRWLADEANFPSQDPRDLEDLAKVSSYYVAVSGRPTLRERLRDVLNHEFTCGPLHQFLASLPTPLVIVSTNYDTLIEQAFIAAGKPYDLVIHPADRKDYGNAILWWPHGAAEPQAVAPNELYLDLARTSVIYKMHGTIERETDKYDNFVITEEDYIEFLSRMTLNTAIPTQFYNHFSTRSFIFLGYGLGDWNLRVVLRNLDKYLTRDRPQLNENEKLPSWAIQLHPSELERGLWKNRQVLIYDLSLDDFVNKMRARQALP